MLIDITAFLFANRLINSSVFFTIREVCHLMTSMGCLFYALAFIGLIIFMARRILTQNSLAPSL
jgi:flagellar biogenesis protein FliO